MKDLYDASKTENRKIVDHVNDASNYLRKGVNKDKIPEKENPDKVIDIVEEIVSFDKQKKGKGLKIFTPK